MKTCPKYQFPRKTPPIPASSKKRGMRQAADIITREHCLLNPTIIFTAIGLSGMMPGSLAQCTYYKRKCIILPKEAAMEHVSQSLEAQVGEHYKVIRQLGQGTFGQVVLANDKISGQSIALKLLRKDQTEKDAFIKELWISFLLSEHNGIIRTYPTYMETVDYYVFSQELAPGGTLHSIIQSQIDIPEEKVKRCAVQLRDALKYLHSKGLVHKDLKTDNVLLMDSDCYHVKLSDFGLTQDVGTIIPSLSLVNPYMSPELCQLQDDEYLVLDPSLDVWAFGVLLFVVLTGSYPWEEATPYDYLFNVFVEWQEGGQCVSSPLSWQHISSDGLAMFSKLLSLKPSERISPDIIMDYLDSPWRADEIYPDISDVAEEMVVETTWSEVY
ncbi:serine/threonine-protein kinase SBK1-like [Pelodytes ibericus]